MKLIEIQSDREYLQEAYIVYETNSCRWDGKPEYKESHRIFLLTVGKTII